MTSRSTAVALLLTIVLVAPSVVSALDKMICAGCGKEIVSGKWLEYNGKYYHAEHFVCAYCKKPIPEAKYYEWDGKVYDSACYYKHIVPRCAFCGKPLQGDWVTFEGKNYHEQCYDDHIAPHCAYCGKLLGENWITYHGKSYHQDCFDQHIALRCSVCGDTISGRYLEDEWGNKYHERHQNDPRCFSCGRILCSATKGGETYPDGRVICGLCLPSTIKTLDVAQRIMLEVKDSLAACGIVIKRDKIPLKFADSKEMAKLQESDRTDLTVRGYTYFEKSTMMYGLITERKFLIYVLYGMPETDFRGIIAHELMHVWLGLNAPMYQNRQMVEGSCGYAMSIILNKIDTEPARHFIKMTLALPDKDYSDGLRYVTAEVDKRGLSGWLDYLKDHTEPPW